ncbi:unnamed protein product [Brachionus calyciflorus]|uniref:G-protein coupled receptors family 3 profile domain-containing protein n=1 Tax=Brachionus calyciflorus TaxID=104777 RepID=A0A814K2D4_9BILA|nr:unnamed protein product [Brachionus calyciflorus]
MANLMLLILFYLFVVESEVCKKENRLNGYQLVCKNFEIDKKILTSNKTDYKQIGKIYYRLSEERILNEDLLIGINFFKSLKKKDSNFYFKNLLGFDLNLFNKIERNNSMLYSFFIYNSKIDFYNRTARLSTCIPFYPENKLNLNIISLYFLNFNKFISKLCPFYFDNFEIDELNFNYLADSFYSKNKVSFTKINESNKLNIQVETLSIGSCENLDINSDIINFQMFKSTSEFRFYGKIKNIESNIFSALTSLKFIMIDIYYSRQLLQNSQIRWIKSLNENLQINDSQFENFTDHIKFVLISQKFYTEFYYKKDLYHLFPDEDFCIYRDFPFNKMVLLSINDNTPNNYKIKYTCTFLWIAQNYSFYLKHFKKIAHGIILYRNFKGFNISESDCNFTKRLENCNFKAINYNEYFDLNFWKNLIIILDFVTSFVLIPLMSALCFLLNLFIFIMCLKGKKLKYLNNKAYKFVFIYSVLSLAYVLIGLPRFLNDCSFKTGLFCSSVKFNTIIQDYKIVVTDFTNRILKTAINLSLIGYSTLRLNLFCESSSKLTKYIYNSSIGNISFVILAILGTICLPKLYIHQINTGEPESRVGNRKVPYRYRSEIFGSKSNKKYRTFSIRSEMFSLHVENYRIQIKCSNKLNDNFYQKKYLIFCLSN